MRWWFQRYVGERNSVLFLSFLFRLVHLAFLLLDGIQQDSIVLRDEPFHGFLLRNAMIGSDRTFLFFSLIDVVTRATQDHVEVQSVNTDAGIVFYSQINVFLETEAEGSHVGKTIFAQLILYDLKTLLQNLPGFGSSYGAMAGNLFVTTNAERTDSVTRLRKDGSLPRQLLQHLRRSGQSISRFTNANV